MLITLIVKILPPFALFILFINSAYAAYPAIEAFTPPPKSYNVKTNIIEVTNIAKIPSQGGRQICYAVAASVFLNAENCRVSKLDCKHLTPDSLFSPAGLVLDGIGDDPEGKKIYAGEGGSPFNSIKVVIYESYSSPSLECTSKEKTMPEFAQNDDGVEKEFAMWEEMLNLYKKISKHAKTIDYGCDECAQGFYNKYKVEFSKLKTIFPLLEDKPSTFLRLMKEHTFRDFVVRLTVPSVCRRAKNLAFFEKSNSLDVAIYPGVNGETNARLMSGIHDSLKTTGNYTESMSIIRGALAVGKVLIIEGICLSKYAKDGTCKDGHVAVISGAMTVCNNQNNKCTELLKVINSWGDKWQAAVNDGWVMAKPLLESTKYRFGTLIWLVDRPPEHEPSE